jgi:hypothetical protein
MPPASAQPVPAAAASSHSTGFNPTCLGRAAEGCQEAANLGDSGRAAETAGPTERSCAVHTEGFSSAAPPPNRPTPQPNNNIMLSLRARETDPRGGLGQVSDSPVPRTLSIGGAHLILQGPARSGPNKLQL